MAFTEIHGDQLETISGGAPTGAMRKAVQIFGQKAAGVRAYLFADGSLKIMAPKTTTQILGGKPVAVTTRGEYDLQPKAPYQH